MILTFATTHLAISAEEALLARGFPLEVVPVPEWIRAGCGLAIRIPVGAEEAALAALTAAGIPWQGLHGHRPSR